MTRPELDAPGTCSWPVASLIGNLESADLLVSGVPARVRIHGDRTYARIEGPLRFDAVLREAPLRTGRTLDLAAGTVFLPSRTKLVRPHDATETTVIAAVPVSDNTVIRDLEVPCEAIEVGTGDEPGKLVNPPAARSVSIPPKELALRSTPDESPVVRFRSYANGGRAALLEARGSLRSLELTSSRGARIRGWVLASDLLMPHDTLQQLVDTSEDDARKTSVIGLLDPGSAEGLGSLNDRGRTPPHDPCLFVPGIEGTTRTARVVRDTPVLRGRVGRRVWAEVATDEPLELFVPTQGDRVRIIRVAGLTPVREGRLCRNIYLNAWIPRTAMLD